MGKDLGMKISTWLVAPLSFVDVAEAGLIDVVLVAFTNRRWQNLLSLRIQVSYYVHRLS